MRILVNALSVNNLSGRHVLLGHFAKIVEWSREKHEFFFLYHNGNRDICCVLDHCLKWIECPEFTKNWMMRALWERTRLPAITENLAINVCFTPSGTVIPGLKIPQVSFAQNPWCLVREVTKKPIGRIKAVIQRKAYAVAMKQADIMVFNSQYMRRAYRQNAGIIEKASWVIYQAIDEKMHDAAIGMRSGARKKYQVVCVSVMAPHKGIETLIAALSRVRMQHGVPAELILIGPWPDAGYQKKIQSLIQSLELQSVVKVTGYIPNKDLHQVYAESRIFCLMSRCESFGIPAVEAQAFGTPVVTSNCCAIPEVCGNGGIFPAPDDINAVATAIACLIEDEVKWAELSAAAVENAEKYHWENCSRPFLDVFEKIASDNDPILDNNKPA